MARAQSSGSSMRIAVLGGEARDLINFRGHLISEMAAAGHTVFGIAPGGTPEIAEGLRQRGARLVPIALNRTGLNPFRDLASLYRMWRLFRNLRLDLIMAYEAKAVVFGTIAAHLAGVPRRFAMITGRGSALQPDPAQRKTMLVARVVKLLYSVALRRIGGVMFQNPDDLAFFIDERMLQERTAHRIINGSGVDIDHFACSPLPEGPVTFIFVGRLLRNKGIQDYADACEQLAQQGVSARFKVLGPLDSNPNAITSHQIEAWKRGGVVEYLGAAQDVRPALASAHVLVLPSSYGEGTPRSVLEAMSMGRAIITTTAPGCKEPVQDRVNGFLIPVKDPKALVDAMLEFVQKPELIPRFGAESRRIAEARYDVRLVTADILSFMGVTKGPGSAVTPAAPSPSPK